MSRAVELVQAIVDTITEQTDIAGQFAFDVVDVRRSYTHAYHLEGLTDYPTVYVMVKSKESVQADRSKRYTQNFVVSIEIVGALERVEEINSDLSTDEISEKWITFADQIERCMRQYGTVLADCTMLNYTCDPLYNSEYLETMNVFQALQTYNYTITERNTL